MSFWKKLFGANDDHGRQQTTHRLKSSPLPSSADTQAATEKVVMQGELDSEIIVPTESILGSFIALSTSDFDHLDIASKKIAELNTNCQPRVWEKSFHTRFLAFVASATRDGIIDPRVMLETLTSQLGIKVSCSIVINPMTLSFDQGLTRSTVYVGFVFTDEDRRFIFPRTDGCIPHPSMTPKFSVICDSDEMRRGLYRQLTCELGNSESQIEIGGSVYDLECSTIEANCAMALEAIRKSEIVLIAVSLRGAVSSHVQHVLNMLPRLRKSFALAIESESNDTKCIEGDPRLSKLRPMVPIGIDGRVSKDQELSRGVMDSISVVGNFFPGDDANDSGITWDRMGPAIEVAIREARLTPFFRFPQTENLCWLCSQVAEASRTQSTWIEIDADNCVVERSKSGEERLLAGPELKVSVKSECEVDYTHKDTKLGEFARLYLRIAKITEGLEIKWNVTGGVIPRSFRSAIENAILDAANGEALGGRAIDCVRISVEYGVSHPIDSTESAFRKASIRAVRDAVIDASPLIYLIAVRLDIWVPSVNRSEFAGKMLSQGAQVEETAISDGYQELTATILAREVAGFASTLGDVTGGAGYYEIVDYFYREAPADVSRPIVSSL